MRTYTYALRSPKNSVIALVEHLDGTRKYYWIGAVSFLYGVCFGRRFPTYEQQWHTDRFATKLRNFWTSRLRPSHAVITDETNRIKIGDKVFDCSPGASYCPIPFEIPEAFFGGEFKSIGTVVAIHTRKAQLDEDGIKRLENFNSEIQRYGFSEKYG